MQPGNQPATVLLTFDFDAISTWIGSFNVKSPTVVSRGEFGATVGAPRILDLLDKYGIQSTWFIPGHTIDSFPKICREVVKGGHEIGHHGYCHENPVSLTLEEEEGILRRGLDCIKKLTGGKPKGYRSPAWDTSPNTLHLLLEYGFEYDSSMMGNDFQLYRCRVGDSFSLTTPYKFGKEVDLVEIPVSWDLDDWPPFTYIWDNPYRYGYTDSEVIYRLWADQFDYMYENVPGGVYNLTMHPQVIGRAQKIMMLEKLIQHIRQRPNVRFTTMYEVVKEWKAKNGPAKRAAKKS